MLYAPSGSIRNRKIRIRRTIIVWADIMAISWPLLKASSIQSLPQLCWTYFIVRNIFNMHNTSAVFSLTVFRVHIVTHSRYAKHPPPAVFLHAVPSRAEVSRSEPSRAEARCLLRKSKQFWQRCLATPVNTMSDDWRAV
jgi:hypothetical protein